MGKVTTDYGLALRNQGGYVIKWAQEAAWAVGIACSIFALELVSATERVDDWGTYLVALGGGAVRVAAAVLLNEVKKLRGND